MNGLEGTAMLCDIRTQNASFYSYTPDFRSRIYHSLAIQLVAFGEVWKGLQFGIVIRWSFERCVSRQNMATELPIDDNGNTIVRIGHSPDPDDAFMFHAMTTNAFPTPGYNFVHELQDIETLNHRAMRKELEVSAVSIHAYPDIAQDYALMNCGASMGEGYGPMVVAKQGVSEEDAKSSPIAIPGMKTSAHMGIRLCWGDLEYEVVPFDEIIPRILDGTYKSGLIIHEGQLTYVEHDLNVLLDLGVWWNNKTGGLPMPLGGNVVRRDLGQKVMEDVTLYTKMSIEHSIANPDTALEFAKKWGRGIDDETNREFVTMYVNDRTIDYKPEGRESVRLFLKEGQRIGLIDADFDVDGLQFIGSPVV